MLRMRELLVLALFAFVATQPAYAQDDAESADNASEEASESKEEDVPVEAVEASGPLATDDESYRDIDDEDFRPSEEIPADQSITFPTDI